MKKVYECRLATLKEIIAVWDSKVEKNKDNNSYKVWREEFIDAARGGTKLCFYGFLDGKMIAECTAVISADDKYEYHIDRLADGKTAYLSTFACDEEYRNQGFFSQLYRYAIDYLKTLGFTAFTIGVEPCEDRNKAIYNNWGFTRELFTDYIEYPPEKQGGERERIEVVYYKKED